MAAPMKELTIEEFFAQFDPVVSEHLVECYRHYAPARQAMMLAISGELSAIDALATGVVFLTKQAMMLIDERIKCLQSHPQSWETTNGNQPTT